MRANLAGKSVVITGASSGNGRAIAREMARHGCRIALAARRESVLEEVASECRALGGKALVVPTDVTHASEITALVRSAIDANGGIDIWVNCAAVLHFGRIDETPEEVLQQVLRTNIEGYILGSQAAVRRFRQQRHGVLINVGSMLGVTGQPFASAYVTSKAAILGLSESLRHELVDEPNIHVCTVLPYAVDTPIYQRAANYLGCDVQPVLPRYSAETVAKAARRLALRPRPNAHAGLLARLCWLVVLLPYPFRALAIRRAIELMQIGTTARSPSAGNLFEPIHDQWKVSGGWQGRDEKRKGR